MTKTINVVNLNGFENNAENEPTTNDAEEMSKIKSDIENEAPPPSPNVEVVEAPPVEAKPKAKRKPPTKKVKEEIKEEVKEEPKEEVKVQQTIEEKETPKKTKTVELVSCPKCNKEMNKKTLRYSHEKNCTGTPVVREEIPVKRREPTKKNENKKEEHIIEKYVAIPEEVIQQAINKRFKEQKESRIKAKEERIKILAANIV